MTKKTPPAEVLQWHRLLTVGECYYVRSVRNDYVGRVVGLGPGPRDVSLEGAAWIANSGYLTDFLRSGRAQGLEVEIVGVVTVERLEFAPWLHPLFEAPIRGSN